MTIRVKQGGIGGGSWRVVNSGGLHLKNGGSWLGASRCRIKIGDKGGGYWFDSGYVGYPAVPTNFYVSGWDFTKVYLHWDTPTGGAPVHHYQVVMTDSVGNWMANYDNVFVNDSINISGNPFNVAEDYRVRFYVRSISAAGLVSDWAPSIGVQIGHTQLDHQQANTATRPWQSGAVGVNLWNGSPAGPQVPGNIAVDHFWVNLSGPGEWAYLSPGTNSVRNIFFITANNIRRDLGRLTLGNPSHGRLDITAPAGVPPNNGWGLWAEGAGYAAGPATSQYRVVGDLEVFGTETYTYYTTVIDRYRVENSYW